MSIDEKSSTQYQKTKFTNTLKISDTMVKWNFSQGCKDSLIYVNQYDISKLKNKNDMTISMTKFSNIYL